MLLQLVFLQVLTTAAVMMGTVGGTLMVWTDGAITSEVGVVDPGTGEEVDMVEDEALDGGITVEWDHPKVGLTIQITQQNTLR
jgi:glyoxylase-like metal-dependent hydrolase (beta-lactamase superfamily II)